MADELDENWFERALGDEDPETNDELTDDESPSDGELTDGATSTDPDKDATGDSASPAEGSEAGGESLFETDFASALEGVDFPEIDGSDADSGDAAFPTEYDDLDFGLAPDQPGYDEAPESDLPRIDLGIDGLDRMIQGGVPERTLLVTMGPAGTGKTTFGLQFLHHALENGEKGVFITLEESKRRVVNSATEKGYAFDSYLESGQLAVIDIDPVEMANSLRSIRSDLPELIAEFGASRLVLDSVSLLEMMYDDRAKRRNEIYDFATSLKQAGVTAMLTSEISETNPYVSRFGIVEYLTDAVFVLQYIRPDDFRETRLAVEIQKIRDANHSREKKPYEITNEGLSVYEQANLF